MRYAMRGIPPFSFPPSSTTHTASLHLGPPAGERLRASAAKGGVQGGVDDQPPLPPNLLLSISHTTMWWFSVFI